MPLFYFDDDDSDRSLLDQEGSEFPSAEIARRQAAQAAFAFLRKAECDEGQGYLMSRPVGPEDLVLWLAGGAYPPEETPP